MPKAKRGRSLEIHEDMDFQRRTWAVERAGWVGMALLVLASLLGLLGPGPLSSATAVDPTSGLWLEYDRCVRCEAPAKLRVQLGPAAAKDGKVRLWLSRPYLDAVRVEQVTPEPELVEAGAGRLTYVFRAAEADGPLAVTFSLKPERAGYHPAEMGLDGSPPLRFGQLVYP